MTTGENAPPPAEGTPPSRTGWLNRNVVGAGLTSFLADAAYETATAALPGFLPSPLLLGFIEGVSDAVSSSVKLASGWWGDRLGHRKAIVTFGYVLSGTASALFAFAAWPLVLAGRLLAWFGRGIRGPLRDAILADSVDPADRGKVFGFHRAGDTLGAIVGPLLGAWLLATLRPASPDDDAAPFRVVFLLTLIPGLGSALAFAVLVREKRRTPRPTHLWASIRALPAPFRRLLVGVGVFGAGDFAHTLLVLAAVEALTPAHGPVAPALAAGLYGVRNVLYAAASFPVGALSDRLGRRGLLVVGYVLGAGVMVGFAAVLGRGAVGLPVLAVLFGLAGVYIAVEDALERALTADLVPDVTLRGTAYGVLGTVNGLGDFLSSAGVGLLWWAFGPVPGFACAAVLMLSGAVLTYRVR
jgi:MFS family permease